MGPYFARSSCYLAYIKPDVYVDFRIPSCDLFLCVFSFSYQCVVEAAWTLYSSSICGLSSYKAMWLSSIFTPSPSHHHNRHDSRSGTSIWTSLQSTMTIESISVNDYPQLLLTWCIIKGYIVNYMYLTYVGRNNLFSRDIVLHILWRAASVSKYKLVKAVIVVNFTFSIT